MHTKNFPREGGGAFCLNIYCCFISFPKIFDRTAFVYILNVLPFCYFRYDTQTTRRRSSWYRLWIFNCERIFGTWEIWKTTGKWVLRIKLLRDTETSETTNDTRNWYATKSKNVCYLYYVIVFCRSSFLLIYYKCCLKIIWFILEIFCTLHMCRM